ncbi:MULTISPECIES: YacL family protein [Pasteurellaceae]|uniref:UPF0231 family protein n=1 Tax=Pasteurellaceae TaxID=712 RepID=UPI003568DC4A
MDFQFTYDAGEIMATCSMGHEALANWLNIEVRSNPSLISTALLQLQNAKIRSFPDDIVLLGCEYSLFINADEVMIKANNLEIAGQDEPEDGFHYYDEESIAFCGTEDFERFLRSYLAFNAQPNG